MRIERLGDLCHIRIGKTPSRSNPDYWGGSMPWATISDLGRSPLADTRERVTDLAARELGMHLVEAGTLLYSFKLTIGKMGVAGVPLYTNEAIAALTPKQPSSLDSAFLRFALMTVDGGAAASVAVKGKTLNGKTLSGLRIPVAAIDEQRRLASSLTAQLLDVDSARSAASSQRETADSLRARAYEVAFAERVPLSVLQACL